MWHLFLVSTQPLYYFPFGMYEVYLIYFDIYVIIIIFVGCTFFSSILSLLTCEYTLFSCLLRLLLFSWNVRLSVYKYECIANYNPSHANDT